MSKRDDMVMRANWIRRSPADVGVISFGERCETALILNDAALLPPGYTFLDAVRRAIDGGADLAELISAQVEVLGGDIPT